MKNKKVLPLGNGKSVHIKDDSIWNFECYADGLFEFSTEINDKKYSVSFAHEKADGIWNHIEYKSLLSFIDLTVYHELIVFDL